MTTTILDLKSPRLVAFLNGWNVARVQETFEFEIPTVGGRRVLVETVVYRLDGSETLMAAQTIGPNGSIDFGRWDAEKMVIHGDDCTFDLTGRTVESV